MHRCTALVALLAAQLAAQRDVWASPTGNDLTGDGSPGNPYRTVSRCVTAAASGDVVRLTAGTFGDDDQIRIATKSLTVRGAGVGQTVVRPHASLLWSLPAGIPPGVAEDHVVAVVVEGGVRVDLRDLTVDNAYRVPPTGRTHNVLYRDGADGSIADCELRGARADPVTTSDRPAAVLLRGDATADAVEVTVRASLIADFGAAGVSAGFDSLARIEECDVLGLGPQGSGGPVQTGILFGFGASGSVRACRITGMIHTPAGPAAASGVAAVDAGTGLRVEANRIAACETGIAISQGSAAVRTCAIRRNVISAVDRGVVVDQEGVTVTDNVVHMAAVEPGRDDTGVATGNLWEGNNWSDWSGSGSYAIAGGSGLADAAPRRDLDALEAATAVALGGVPVDLVVAAFDSTAGPDFATVDAPSAPGARPALSVGLASGGTFNVTALPFAAADVDPAALCSGEFDGSPGLDLAAVTSDHRFVVFANDGSGGFSVLHDAALPPAALSPADVAAADADGDGRDDLFVASLGGLATPGGGTYLHNDGGGTAWTATALPGSFTAQCKALAVARLDANASVDVALVEGDGTFGRMLVYANDGSGSFAALGAAIALGPDPTALVAGDVDGDGDVDLAVAQSNVSIPLVAGRVDLLRNDGGGSFTAAGTLATGRGPQGLALGDLDGDDDPDDIRRDLVVVNFADGQVQVLEEAAAGGFTASLVGSAGTTPRAAAISDVDGDGRADLVAADAAGMAVVVRRAAALARADSFGAGCPGAGGRAPILRPGGGPPLPLPANLGFAVEVAAARPFAVGVLVASSAPPAGLAGCSFLLASVDVAWVFFTDAGGGARVGLPVPAPPPSLRGTLLSLQAAVFDAAGGFAGGLSLTQGLRLRVGR